MQTQFEIEQQIKELERALVKLKEVENNKRFTPADSFEKKLAIIIHSQTCTQNHTDGCGWYYEIENKDLHDWNAHSHINYLKVAQSLSFTFDLELKEYELFFDILKGRRDA